MTSEQQRLILYYDGHFYERFMLIAYTVLEGILNEGDENKWRYLTLWCFIWKVKFNTNLVRIAQLHQRDIMPYEIKFTR